MSSEKQTNGIKVVLLGDAAAGKSSLLTRFTTGDFQTTLESTIGAAFKSKTLQRGDKFARLDIWDTAGQERYRAILPMYYRNASAAILVIDVTSRLSLNVAERWIMDIRQQSNKADIYLILAVNKVDLPDKCITSEEVQSFCVEKGIDFMETSAKSGYNVNELFERVCDNCLKSEIPVVQPGVISCIEITPKANVKKGCCK